MTDKPHTVLFADLRASTCAKLGYDITQLAPHRESQVTTIALLLLEQDRQVAAALRGERIDPRDAASINEQLQNAYHPAHSDSPEGRSRADEEIDFEITKLIDGVLTSREFEADAKMQREELAAVAAAMPEVAPVVAATREIQNQPQGSNDTHVSYIDHGVIEPLPDRPPVPTPLTPADQVRFASLGNPNSQPTLRSPLPPSTYSPFAAWSAGQNGVKRWEPPPGF